MAKQELASTHFYRKTLHIGKAEYKKIHKISLYSLLAFFFFFVRFIHTCLCVCSLVSLMMLFILQESQFFQSLIATSFFMCSLNIQHLKQIQRAINI